MSKLPIFEHFLSVGNLKPKLKPKFCLLNWAPEMMNLDSGVTTDVGPTPSGQRRAWHSCKSRTAGNGQLEVVVFGGDMNGAFDIVEFYNTVTESWRTGELHIFSNGWSCVDK